MEELQYVGYHAQRNINTRNATRPWMHLMARFITLCLLQAFLAFSTTVSAQGEGRVTATLPQLPTGQPFYPVQLFHRAGSFLEERQTQCLEAGYSACGGTDPLNNIS
jgi:hypothetical protein